MHGRRGGANLHRVDAHDLAEEGRLALLNHDPHGAVRFGGGRGGAEIRRESLRDGVVAIDPRGHGRNVPRCDLGCEHDVVQGGGTGLGLSGGPVVAGEAVERSRPGKRSDVSRRLCLGAGHGHHADVRGQCDKGEETDEADRHHRQDGRRSAGMKWKLSHVSPRTDQDHESVVKCNQLASLPSSTLTVNGIEAFRPIRLGTIGW